ncbi:MAG: hypothetical protein JNL01_06840 [Bdellovibrionales bacterium]|nr:hypothetical protein [Bdellovibrionales bacterium]
MKPKELDDIRLIAGVFREALFLGLSVEFETVTGEIRSSKILAIDEKDTRSTTETKFLILAESVDGILDSQKGFRVRFPGFVAQWIPCGDFFGSSKIPVPSLVQIRNERVSKRMMVGASSDCSDVLLEDGHLATRGLIKVVDVSKNGLGAELEVPTQFPIHLDTKVRGIVEIQNGVRLAVSGTVVQATLVEENGSKALYRVGVKQGTTSEAVSNINPRFPVEGKLVIELVSQLNSSIRASFAVLESSVSGFSGVCVDSRDVDVLSLGLSFGIRGTSLTCRLIEAEERKHTFALLVSDMSQMKQWISITDMKGFSTRRALSLDRTELLRLFCEAGALGSQFLKQANSHSKKMLSVIDEGGKSGFWIHRWIEEDAEEGIRGHAAAYRMGDNMWLIGDIVGSTDSKKKISKKLIPGFLSSFGEQSLSSSPSPLSMIMWKRGHPFWRAFEEHLKECNYVLGRFTVSYARFEEFSESAQVRSLFSEVKSSDFSTIKSIGGIAETCGVGSFIRAFDFDYDRFASPVLRSEFEKAELNFFRKYFILQTEGGQIAALVIVNKFPMNGSLIRSTDSVWLVPFLKEGLPPSTIHGCALLAAEYGVASHGLRVVSAVGFEPREFSSLVKLECFLGTPLIWRFFT